MAATVGLAADRPNILFAFAEDWGRYASAYAEHEAPWGLSGLLATPNFDRVAKEGVLFLNARAPAPGCNPCRSSVMSGRYFWQTGLGAIEQGTVWDETIPTFPLELERNGYFLGYTYEGDFGKTNARLGGTRNAFHPAGHAYDEFSRWVTTEAARFGGVEEAKAILLREVLQNFRGFLDAPARLTGQPFCYCWGPTTTHRGAGWAPGSGRDLWGIEPDALRGRLPAFLPDVPEIRQDMADYLGECCAMDAGLGVLLAELEARSELDRTLIVVSGDHGVPGMPRAKANLYDFGCQVALAARWPRHVPPGRVVDDFINIMDLAPTFCEAGGVEVPASMTAKSLMPILTSTRGGQVEAERDFVVSGLERFVSVSRVVSRDQCLPYPQRSLRTAGFLYIINFEHERWPVGDPHGLDDTSHLVPASSELAADTLLAFPDFDASPTKSWMICHRGEPAVENLYQLAFGKRPRAELYDLQNDPHQMHNVADDPTYAAMQERMEARLKAVLVAEKDPRMMERPCRFELPPYTTIAAKYETEKGKAQLEALQRIRRQWHGAKAKL